MLLWVGGGLFLGSVNTMTIFISDILEPFGFSVIQTSLIGGIPFLIGLILTMIVS
jgi:hypothetical protein